MSRDDTFTVKQPIISLDTYKTDVDHATYCSGQRIERYSVYRI
jgi:hypothetical protein